MSSSDVPLLLARLRSAVLKVSVTGRPIDWMVRPKSVPGRIATDLPAAPMRTSLNPA